VIAIAPGDVARSRIKARAQAPLAIGATGPQGRAVAARTAAGAAIDGATVGVDGRA
jgi:hypothetical protein